MNDQPQPMLEPICPHRRQDWVYVEGVGFRAGCLDCGHVFPYTDAEKAAETGGP